MLLGLEGPLLPGALLGIVSASVKRWAVGVSGVAAGLDRVLLARDLRDEVRGVTLLDKGVEGSSLVLEREAVLA